jgi:hypothetical protein
MKEHISNCPNCGAPLREHGKCIYCGTVIEQPLQILAVRPGVKKLVCEAQVPLWLAMDDAEAASEYVKRDIRGKMADALTDSIKFLSKREFDPGRFQEIITVRGELWIGDPGVSY